jgi:carbamoyl-phosphate synthase large subunit
MKVLLTNSGRRTYIVKYLFELQDSYDSNIEVFVSDTSIDVPSFWVDERIHQIVTPRVDKDNDYYIEVLLQKCQENDIDIIIPLMDYELCLLAKNKEQFKEIKTTVVVSDYAIVENCLDKNKCYEFCIKNSILIPKTWHQKEKISTDKGIVVKKINGSGSVDLHNFKSKEVISTFFDDTFLYQELIVGQEYGMDILNDFDGNFLHCCARKKLAMRAGETDKAEVIYDERFTKLAKIISLLFKHIGNMDIDFIVDEGGAIYFIDFNPRFGGGYPFTHLAGFNYIKAIFELHKDRQTSLPFRGKRIVGMKGIETFVREVDS